MKLPANFAWIMTTGVLPKMIVEGLNLLGIQEIQGNENNPKIIEFAVELGVADIYTSDDKQPWCALSHCSVAKRAGKIISYPNRYDYLRALAFAKQPGLHPEQWELLDTKDAMFGDSLIFKRPEGGHLGMYIGESDTHYYVMGGNQNNMYGFTRVAKTRLVAVVRPKYHEIPSSVKKYFLSDTGTPVTANEK